MRARSAGTRFASRSIRTRTAVRGVTGDQSLFDLLEREFPAFEYEVLAPQRESWVHPATKLRCAIDYLRYFEPEFAKADDLRARARGRAPWYMRILGALGVFRLRLLRRATDRLLRAIERQDAALAAAASRSCGSSSRTS